MARLNGINCICVVGSSCLDCNDLAQNDQRPNFSVISKTFPDGPGALLCQNTLHHCIRGSIQGVPHRLSVGAAVRRRPDDQC